MKPERLGKGGDQAFQCQRLSADVVHTNAGSKVPANRLEWPSGPERGRGAAVGLVLGIRTSIAPSRSPWS